MQTDWKPQPGELVEWRGAWRVVHETGPTDVVEFREKGHVWFWCGAVLDWTPTRPPEYCKPLLPACRTMAEAWDALKGLPEATADHDDDRLKRYRVFISVPLETGHLEFYPESGEPPRWKGYSIHAHDYAARGRDWQKEGTMRQWIAGVQAREGESEDIQR